MDNPTPSHSPDSNLRFHALDALRGLAALGIVVYHYNRHFHSVTPFHFLLKYFYFYGNFMVDLFFCLSGFIFFWKYSDAVINHSIGFTKFMWLRISRLYPLHLVTLLFVAVVQWILLQVHGEIFNFQIYDLKHLALQILFIHHWGLQDDLSFNGPSWSISLEILMYLIFFATLARFRKNVYGFAGLLVILGWFLVAEPHDYIIFNSHAGEAVILFFMGGFVFRLFHFVNVSHPEHKKHAWLLTCLVTLAFWTVVLIFTYNPGPWVLSLGNLYMWTYFVGFPATVFLFSLFDADEVTPWIFRRLAFLGDISYSVYLIHFPLQLVIYFYTKYVPIDFSSHTVFIMFFSATLILAFLTHKYFEMPCRKYLRSRIRFT